VFAALEFTHTQLNARCSSHATASHASALIALHATLRIKRPFAKPESDKIITNAHAPPNSN